MWRIPEACIVFEKAQGGWGGSLVAGMYGYVSSQAFSTSSAEKNMCLGFQWETTKNAFRFFQLESAALESEVGI